ncbi:MAG: hypothetical protein Q8L14_35870 [Myxococcales bacterium]|nr:hypothetical protein [Myxococcales bacterium]
MKTQAGDRITWLDDEGFLNHGRVIARHPEDDTVSLEVELVGGSLHGYVFCVNERDVSDVARDTASHG